MKMLQNKENQKHFDVEFNVLHMHTVKNNNDKIYKKKLKNELFYFYKNIYMCGKIVSFSRGQYVYRLFPGEISEIFFKYTQFKHAKFSHYLS